MQKAAIRAGVSIIDFFSWALSDVAMKVGFGFIVAIDEEGAKA